MTATMRTTGRNEEFAAAMRLVRRSLAASPHADRRTARRRARGDRERAAVRDSREER